MNTLIKPPCTNGTLQDKQLDSRLAAMTNLTETFANTGNTYLMVTQANDSRVEECNGTNETVLLRNMYSYLYEAANIGASGGDSFTCSLVKVPKQHVATIKDVFNNGQEPKDKYSLSSWLKQYDGIIIETQDIPEDYIPVIVVLANNHAYIDTEVLTEKSNFYDCPFEEGMSVWSIVGHIIELLDAKDTTLFNGLNKILKSYSSSEYKLSCLAISPDASGIVFNSWFEIEDYTEFQNSLEIDDELIGNFDIITV